jgi:lysyl-tRNA synthetase class 2
MEPCNPISGKHLETRSKIIRAVRRFFYDRDYIEVETPIRIPCPIPEAHIDPFDSEGWSLQASPEICMTQLLARGHERLFQIARVFRKDERGDKHLPEFSLLEWYTKDATYLDLMDQATVLFLELSADMGLGQSLQYQNHTISLKPPWDSITVAEAFERYSSTTVEKALDNGSYDEVMGFEIEPKLGYQKPVFLYDYPESKASLARLKQDDPKVAERVELYIAGLELANGFTELNDFEEQSRRFKAEHMLRSHLGKKNYSLPEPFLQSLAHLPPCAGIAAGLDRILMLFCDTKYIDDVVAFVPENL